MTLEESLSEITSLIDHDPNIDADTRESLTELIAQVSADPTPANMKVLALVIEKLSDVTRYIGALNTMKGLEFESAQIPPSAVA